MATIVMPASEVIEAAKVVIARIKDVRYTRDEESIANVTPRSFCGITLRPRTRDEAIKYLRSILFGHYPSVAYGVQLEQAQKLLKLAQKGDPVTLNENDIHTLF